jgi:phosphoserine phosphatase
MLEPITSLAFSVSSGKGVYALLLGSGMSRAAKIPTGWEITLDLIRQVAAAAGENAEEDPEAWYRGRFKQEADYSRLLDSLGNTPADRNNLLSRYFEPTQAEITQGDKLPTSAHKAIARLVSKGYFRVIITTNFDRLLEHALESVGISPTVISSADALKGALPLTHARCTIIKVNGDYRDTRIKNTAAELEHYDSDLDSLLDRVLDEYGLIVCGWSAAWDTALRNALLRSPNRRFSMYWMAKGEASNEAKQLISHRHGMSLTIDSADQFFAELEAKLDALERYAQPHPLSAELAVISLKKYIAEDKYRIELYDLLMREVDIRLKTFARLSTSELSLADENEDILEQIKVYEYGMEMLIRLIANGSYWGRVQHQGLWGGIVRRLLTLCPQASGLTHLLSLRYYPACLAFYTAGVSAIAAGSYETLKILMRDTHVRVSGKDKPLALALDPEEVLEYVKARKLMKNRVPMNTRIFNALREPLRDYLPSDSDYGLAFDRFEYLLALVHLDLRMENSDDLGIWAPVGRFAWARYEGISVTQQLSEELKKESANWLPLKAQLFSSQEHFLELEKTFKEKVLPYVGRSY